MIMEANVAALRAVNHFTDTLNTACNFMYLFSNTIENIF